GRLLLDRDRRRQPFDRVEIGLLHELEKLPRISRQALDIAALPLGIDRVKGERGFPRARQPGDDDQAVARQVDIDILQIVFPRAADADLLHGVKLTRLGGRSYCATRRASCWIEAMRPSRRAPWALLRMRQFSQCHQPYTSS